MVGNLNAKCFVLVSRVHWPKAKERAGPVIMQAQIVANHALFMLHGKLLTNHLKFDYAKLAPIQAVRGKCQWQPLEKKTPK
jgi:hypothetical protein